MYNVGEGKGHDDAYVNYHESEPLNLNINAGVDDVIEIIQTTYLQLKWRLAGKNIMYNYLFFIECMLNINKLFKNCLIFMIWMWSDTLIVKFVRQYYGFNKKTIHAASNL